MINLEVQIQSFYTIFNPLFSLSVNKECILLQAQLHFQDNPNKPYINILHTDDTFTDNPTITLIDILSENFNGINRAFARNRWIAVLRA